MYENISIPSNISSYQKENYSVKVKSSLKFQRRCMIKNMNNVYIDKNGILKWNDDIHVGDFNDYCEKLLNILKEHAKNFPYEGIIEWQGDDNYDFGYYEIKNNGEWKCHFHIKFEQQSSPWKEFMD